MVQISAFIKVCFYTPILNPTLIRLFSHMNSVKTTVGETDYQMTVETPF